MRFAFAVFALLPLAAVADPHPFNVHDLVMMDRVSDPQISPDGKRVAYQLRETDYDANKGVNSIWVVDLGGKSEPLEWTVGPLPAASSPRWSPDGKYLYVLSKAKDDTTTQVWRLLIEGTEKGGDAGAARVRTVQSQSVDDAKAHLWRLELTAKDGSRREARRITNLPLDVGSFKLSPDGNRILVSVEVFADCADLACTKKRFDDKAKTKASGRLYDKLFIRHWDTWADGTRSQLFIADVPEGGDVVTEPRLVTKGIDGDVPSKPFGDDGEYSFSPDGKTVYFDARIAGKTEPWSTNFDIYSVPADGSAAPKNLTASNQAWDSAPLPSADGKTLYYLAMKRPTFEADRFGIMALDLASGKSHEIDPKWDRSAGQMQLSNDGRTLYTTADDNGDHALFAVDVATGKATRLGGPGQVEGFSVRGSDIVLARSTLKAPADLFQLGTSGARETQVTHLNSTRLADAQMGDYEFFTFKGADNASVQGYVVKPVGFDKGKRYPVAFIIHGGPQGAMTNEFHYRWNPQTYAGAGFAVVTVNFHGSTGYGQAFTDAISGDWGGKPLEDLQKGWAAALDKYTFLDGDRACALGASYGGYMTYWIAGNWTLPWKCLVDHDGVFDSRMMAYSTEELWFDEWEHHGTQWENPQAYEKFNPINHVAAWKVPILVVHGEKDFRIPVEQGIAAFTAAQRRGIPSQLLVFPDENHWVLKPQNSVLWHDTVNAWLKRWTQAPGG
jgi:dipeptidyl aminopeptidase/acylaminoacyl peptidase